MKSINEELGSTTYPGRGIIIGKTKSGKAAMVYFIMGRSENSRNRVFVEDGEGIKTKAVSYTHLDVYKRQAHTQITSASL